ncbi:hypothetical protein N864_16775 [Intrasporangium chromatireducens Q5-1]|uniref:Uncharacterized protein n=1 Tax=Intrasporangium chromatireducens Q5-1 TaxID=584657 RepID=W9GSD6_9MICO|nr:hypothetical protein [Intrasporangium chromatireducens]EWT06809.1 hypothetical protein N864_16775 [Intrasporangium chromatireducens Q5-1]
MRYGKSKSGMAVAELLGIGNEDSEVLTIATRRWPHWAEEDERLRVTELRKLRSWLRTATAEDADEVLHALAKRASIHGADDPVAASTLAFALLPGACTLAHRLLTLSPRLDEIIAAQLWLEIRSFPWDRLGKVAANILRNTRAGVLHECDAGTQVQKRDPTLHHTVTIDPDDTFWKGPRLATIDSEPTPADELLELLAWACDNDVITTGDRSLLLSLAVAADQADQKRSRGRAGLLANDVSETVAHEYGVTAITVRRRASRSLQALAEACAGRGISA